MRQFAEVSHMRQLLQIAAPMLRPLSANASPPSVHQMSDQMAQHNDQTPEQAC